MHRERLEIVRQTRLDLAQWIAAGIARCQSKETCICLARYAAAQLEGVALITPQHRPERAVSASLLRQEINRLGSKRVDCVTVLTRVSRAMIQILLGGSKADRRNAMQDLTVAQIVRLEIEAVNALVRARAKRAAA